MSVETCDCPGVIRRNGGELFCPHHGTVALDDRPTGMDAVRRAADSDGVGWLKVGVSRKYTCYECDADIQPSDELYLSPAGQVRCTLCTPLAVVRSCQ